MLYAHKSFVGEVKRAEKDGTVFIFQEEIPYKAGELIFTGVNNEQQILTESTFESYFVPVEKVTEKKVKKTKSPFESAYLDELARGYMEMANLNQNEDQDYINELKGLRENKAF